MFKVIFSVAFFLFAALSVLIGIKTGKKYRWQFSISKIILTLLAALIAMVVSALVGWALGKSFSGVLATSLIDSFPIFEGMEQINGVATVIVAGIVAPFIFYIAFPVSRAFANSFSFDLANVFMKLDGDATDAEIERRLDAAEKGMTEEEYLLSKLKRERKAKSRKRLRKEELRVTERNILGALVGGLMAFLLFCIYLVPATGLCTVVNNVTTILPLTSIGDTGETITTIADGAANNVGAVAVRSLGGNALYAGMTSCPIDGKFASLSTEADFIAKFSKGLELSAPPSEEEAVKELSEEELEIQNKKAADALRDAAKSFQKTTILPIIMADILPETVDDWRANNEEALIPKPAIADKFDTILDQLKNTSVSTVKADFATFLNISAISVETGVANDETLDSVTIFSNEEFARTTIEELLSNPRFAGSVAPLINNALSSSADKIGIPETIDKYYKDFLEEIYDAYAESSKKNNQASYLKRHVNSIFNEFAIRVTDTTAETFTSQAMQQFGGKLSKESFKKFISESPFDIILPDGTVAHDTISSQEKLEQYSIIVTLKDIEVEPVSVSNVKNEADALAIALHNIQKFNDILDSDEEADTTGAAIKALGAFIDALARSEHVGKDQANTILTAILQSKELNKRTGISNLQAADLAASITESGSYVESIEELGTSIEVMEMSSSGEPTVEQIKNLIKNVTPEIAEHLKKLFTTSVLERYDVSTSSSERIVELINYMIDNLLDAKERGISKDQLEKEATALSDMFEIIMGDSGDEKFNLAFGANSATGLTAQEFVDRTLASDIVSKSLVDAVYKGKPTYVIDPLKLSTKSTEEEQGDLINALNTAWKAGSGSTSAELDQLKQELTSIASLLNCNVTVSNSGVSLTPTEQPAE